MKVNYEPTHSVIPTLLINKVKEIASSYNIPCKVEEVEIFTVMDTVNLYFFKDKNAILKLSIDCINSGEEYIKKYIDGIKKAFEKTIEEFGSISKVDIVKGTNS